VGELTEAHCQQLFDSLNENLRSAATVVVGILTPGEKKSVITGPLIRNKRVIEYVSTHWQLDGNQSIILKE
jgi:hypothetical protein